MTASSSVTTRQCSSKLVIALAVPSLDGDPDGLTPTLGLDDLLLQAMEPDAAVEHLTYQAIFAYEDAAFGVCGGVAGMDADALEFRHAEQDGEPRLELRAPRDHYRIAAFRNRRAAFYLIGLTDEVGIVYGKRFSRFQEIDWEE